MRNRFLFCIGFLPILVGVIPVGEQKNIVFSTPSISATPSQTPSPTPSPSASELKGKYSDYSPL